MTSNPPTPQLKMLFVGDIRQEGDYCQLQDTRRARYNGNEVPGPVRPVTVGFGIPLIPADLLATNWFRPI